MSAGFVETLSQWTKVDHTKNRSVSGAIAQNQIYTNDQPIHDVTMSFIFAEQLCITVQYKSFKQVEEIIEEVLDNMTTYYKINSLRANPNKTQITAFHLMNEEANNATESAME